ncbi:MAG TPA: hypothetical protein VKC15_18980, partial [Gemmatimonadales bacterium]|nr:hypothetical protein [Gemmatimonadales bacterium]
MEGLPLVMGLAADGGDVRRAEYPGVSSRVGVMRMSLSDALACGPAAWDGLQARSASPSPFMTWAWHRAWADSASPDEAHTSEVLALNGPGGSLEALLPVRLGRVRFRRVWVPALTWAIEDIGCPDELDVPGLPGAD